MASGPSQARSHTVSAVSDKASKAYVSPARLKPRRETPSPRDKRRSKFHTLSPRKSPAKALVSSGDSVREEEHRYPRTRCHDSSPSERERA